MPSKELNTDNKTIESRDGAVAERTGRENILPTQGIKTTTAMTIHVIPQAHIDLMWYWPPSEGVRMVLNTFRRHVEKLESNPDFTYAQSQAAAYEYVLRNDPELFSRIQKLVAKGQWELVGGEWVEADTVLPGPEARLRQFLLGQNFFKQHFGKKSMVGWCPDGFIFLPDSFPQILCQAGMHFFVHKRPREKFTKLPVTPYRWCGSDGSQVLALRSNNKGNGIPVLSEGTKAPIDMGDLAFIAQESEKLQVKYLWGPMGIGDIGGINSFELPQLPAQLTCRFSTPTGYFEAITKNVNISSLPSVHGSLPWEMTGALTTWASVKTLNRQAENVLQIADYLSSIAMLFGLDISKQELNKAWKDVLFLQFHDSLTGCGTEDIVPIIEHSYRQAIIVAEYENTRLMRQIAESIKVDFNKGLPVTVFNPLGHCRSDVVSARVTIPRDFLDLVPFGRSDTLTHCVDVRSFIPENGATLEAVDLEGKAVPVMIQSYAQVQKKFVIYVRFLVSDLPLMGYKTFYLRKCSECNHENLTSVKESQFRTDKLDITFDFVKGGIQKLISFSEDVEHNAAQSTLGQLAIHHTGNYELDYGIEHRAWYTGFTGDIDVLHPMSHAIQRYSGGRVGVVFDYEFGTSTFQQEFLIEQGADFVDVTLRGNWQEVEKYLKVHFAVQPQNELVAFADLPYGFTGRLPEGKEYSMQYIAGIRDGKSFLVISNNSRHGCMWQDGCLSLSAIRCATYPAYISDRGEFEMKYRISAFGTTGCDWQRRAFQVGYDFNITPNSYAQEYSSNQRQAAWAFLGKSFDDILVTCLKPAEDSKGLILRFFNPKDKPAKEVFIIPDGFARAVQTNILEEPIEDAMPLTGSVELTFRAYEIKTLLLEKEVQK